VGGEGLAVGQILRDFLEPLFMLAKFKKGNEQGEAWLLAAASGEDH
jgi:hypothetical protein